MANSEKNIKLKFCVIMKKKFQRALVLKNDFFLISDAAYRFFGNHTHADYFKLLKRDGQSLLIGARNVIYNISLPYLTENVEQVNHGLTLLFLNTSRTQSELEMSLKQT